MKLKEKLEDYTEQEFKDFLDEFFENPQGLKGKELADHINKLQAHLVQITGHPEGNGLIFNPPDNREDSQEGVIKEILRWRMEQGLPLFKDHD